MKRFMVLTVMLPALAFAAGAQPANDLYQRALVQERAVGKLDSAIALYQRVIREAGADRALAAHALLSLGRAYETLGRVEARSAYERLVREFGDQRDLATQARARLTALEPGARQGGTGVAAGTPMTQRVFRDADATPNGAPSGDGRYVSFTDWATGDLAVHDLSTGQNRRVTDKGTWMNKPDVAGNSVMSADGKQIAYAWYAFSVADKRDGFDLRIIPVQGGKPRVVVHGDLSYVQPLSWSPDGRSIVATLRRTNNDNATLALIDVADGAVRELRTFPASLPMGATFSPDGGWIAFDVPAGDALGRSPDIRIVRRNGTGEHALVEHPASDWSPFWTPDGRGILFMSDRTGNWGAWLLDVADGAARGEPVLLKGDMGRNFPLGFARDGRFFYTPMAIRDVAVATVDLRTGSTIDLPKFATKSSIGSHGDPDWSPDGRSLAVIAIRGSGTGIPGSRAVAIVDMAAGQQREFWPQLVQFGKPRWSKDGGSILLTGVAAGQVNGLYRLDATTGALATVLGGQRIIPTEAEWSADGRSIFYIRGESGLVMPDANGRGTSRSLVRYDLADSSHHVVYSPDSLHILRGLTASRDGRWIAFTSCEMGRCTSKALLLATGEIRELPIGRPGGVGRPGGYNSLNWTPDGELIGMKWRSTDDMMDLWRIPIDSGPARQLGFEARSLVNLRINPDGRHIAYVAVTDDPNVGGIWIVENFLPPPRKKPAK